MSHHKHTTEAFVLNVVPVKEGDAIVTLVTKNGEILRAVATSLRLHKSKMRMSVVPYSKIRVSLVRGKERWRLTNAESIKAFFPEIKSKTSKLALARTISLCLRLSPGESHVGEMFYRISEYAESLCETLPQDISSRECHVALGVLADLGYMDKANGNKSLEYVRDNIKQVIKEINQSIESSNL